MKTNLNTSVLINIIKTFTMMILSFITFPYVCRVLQDSALGTYQWVAAFVYYFFVLARISLPNIAVRECVKVKDNPKAFTTKVYEFFILQGIMTLLSFGLLCVLAFTIPAFKSGENIQPLIFILSLNFLTGVLSFEWVYTALEKHVFMSLRSIVIAAVLDVIMFVAVKRPGDLMVYALINVSTTILTVIINLIFLPRAYKFTKCGQINLKQYLPSLGILLVMSLSIALYDKTDSFILGLIDESKASVGAYSVGIKAIEMVLAILTGLSTVFIPRASYYYSKNDMKQYNNLNKYSSNIALFLVIPAIGLFMPLCYQITKLISGEVGYEQAGMTLLILSVMMITYSISYIIYTQVLIPLKKEKYYMFSMLFGTILNAGLSVLFGMVIFKDTPAIGVALGTVISDALILIFLFSRTWEYSKIMLFTLNTLKVIIGGVVVASVGTLCLTFLTPNLEPLVGQIYAYLINLSITLVVGGALYIFILILLKEKLIMSIIHRRFLKY